MVFTIGSTVQRRRIIIQGIVQGVGFRPFVYGLALRLGLVGFVLNDSLGVTIEIEGATEVLDDFQRALHTESPPLARIDTITAELVPLHHESTFNITHSQVGAVRQALISPDTATCEDCLHELFDPSDRRYCYPFINCTNCGPRFTIVQDVPYDRNKTTMRVFPMCAACQREYDDPLNRRFHAQPNACPTCGPQMHLFDEAGHSKHNEDAIPVAAQQLADGMILAIKGIGGYHLACDALNVEAVQRLRQRKRREAKPFALMVADVETARQLCHVSDAEAALLQSRQRPIVLLKRREEHDAALSMQVRVAPEVSPAYNTLGMMLPYTPLHHVLLRAFARSIERRGEEHLGKRSQFDDTSIRIALQAQQALRYW